MLGHQKEFEQRSSWQSLRSPHVHQCCQEKSFSKPDSKSKSIIGLVMTAIANKNRPNGQKFQSETESATE